MATLSTPLHSVTGPTSSDRTATTARAATRSLDVPVVLAAVVGALGGLAGTWLILATQTLHMSL